MTAYRAKGLYRFIYWVQTVVFRFVFTLTKWMLSFCFVLFFIFSPVSRLHCESESFKMDLILDVNIQIYPVDLGRLHLICVYFWNWKFIFIIVGVNYVFSISKFPCCKCIVAEKPFIIFCSLRWQVQTGNSQHIIWRWNAWWWRVQSYRWSTIKVNHFLFA